jgi:hypothetical protein
MENTPVVISRPGFYHLMEYKRRADADRQTVLAELAAYDQELGI